MKVMRFVKCAFFTPTGHGRWGQPLLFLGEPGIAKSAVLREFGALWGVPTEVLAPGERGEGEFGVVPVPVEEDGRLILARPMSEWTQPFFSAGRGLVVVDEIIDSPIAVRPALMGLALDGRIGGGFLPPGVRRMALGNPVELSTNGYELSNALANRFAHYTWPVPTAKEHNTYMLRGDDDFGETEVAFDVEAEEARVKKIWPKLKARAFGLETAFIAKRSTLKNQCPKPGDPRGSGAWASDRTWEAAARALAGAWAHDLSESETEEYVSGFIGTGPANEWFRYMERQDLPDPEDILDGKVDFQHEPMRLDRTIATLNSCTALVTPMNAPRRRDRAKMLWTLLREISDLKTDKDIVVSPVIALTQAKLHDGPIAQNVLASLKDVLKASGFMKGN